jgi:hypothetical protein
MDAHAAKAISLAPTRTAHTVNSSVVPHMPSYRFAICRGVGKTEMLGFMRLRDDAEAFDFAKRIIRDMPDEDRRQGGGCSVRITDGEREVGYISCAADFEV